MSGLENDKAAPLSPTEAKAAVKINLHVPSASRDQNRQYA